MKRFLNCTASDFKQMSKKELLDSIMNSEGRVLVSETVGTTQPMLGDITNAEFACAMGADMIILNVFDVNHPKINGLPKVEDQDVVKKLKELTGRPIGINLEPLDEEVKSEIESDDMWNFTQGRKATLDNVEKAISLGVDFVVLTGNPGIGVTNRAITSTIRKIKEKFHDQIIVFAGKMHASGISSEGGEKMITKELVQEFAQAGADVILMPAPGTVPGITMDYIRELVQVAHEEGKLTMTAIGTSQEGATVETIREIALMCKMTGTDLHHIGDAGYGGMALPENILEYGKVIRGIRHTYHRMASSINR